MQRRHRPGSGPGRPLTAAAGSRSRTAGIFRRLCMPDNAADHLLAQTGALLKTDSRDNAASMGARAAASRPGQRPGAPVAKGGRRPLVAEGRHFGEPMHAWQCRTPHLSCNEAGLDWRFWRFSWRLGRPHAAATPMRAAEGAR